MASTVTVRRILLSTIVEIIKNLRGSRYFVRRGSIIWNDFPFTKQRFAASVTLDESMLLPSASGGGRAASIGIEMFGKMYDPVPNELPGFDDTQMDEFWIDAELIVDRLIKMRAEIDGEDQPVVLKLIRGEVKIREAEDRVSRVQGVIVTIPLEF